MITKEELDAKLKKDIEGFTDATTVAQKLMQHIQYSAERYNELTDEAKKMVDKQLEGIRQMNEIIIQNIRTQPDSVANRKLIRMHRKTQGSHFTVEELMAHIEKGSGNEASYISEARKVFLLIAQQAYDFLCDITDRTIHGGGMIVAKLGLLYSAMEEAMVAFHLTSRSYAPQSMSHIRNITQTVDLISVFEQLPESLDYWSSDDYKERAKVSPKSVRKLLGKTEIQENVYWTLSDFGSHPSFKYIKTKTHIKRSDGGPQFRINVGGVSDEFHTKQALAACFAETLLLLEKITSTFPGLLLEEEVTQALDDAQSRIQILLSTHMK